MCYQHSDSVIQVFCKAPIAGQVKTRLMTVLSAEHAMQVHIELTERMLKLLQDAKLCTIQLWCSPSVEFDFFRQLAAKYHLTLHQQSDCGLGGRMSAALNAGLQDFKQVLLIGCDCPTLMAEDFNQAISALKQGADVVLAPTEDGGYSLIGVNKPQAAVLNDRDMPWGTSEVLTITRERLKQQQLNGHEIRQQWDIDTPEDLARYYNLMRLNITGKRR